MSSNAFLPVALIALPVGMIASWLMNLLMRRVSQQRDVPVNMVAALGSLIIRREEGAERVGTVVHFVVGVIFAAIYLGLFVLTGLTALGQTLALGLGFGLIHGVVVTLGLMIVVDEQHPIEKYRRATFAVGLIHLFGHILFGGLIGLLGGLGFLLF